MIELTEQQKQYIREIEEQIKKDLIERVKILPSPHISSVVDSYIKRTAKQADNDIKPGDWIPVGAVRSFGSDEDIPYDIPNHFVTQVVEFDVTLSGVENNFMVMRLTTSGEYHNPYDEGESTPHA